MKVKGISVAMLGLVGLMTLAINACSKGSNKNGGSTASDELQRDLELAATSDGLSLANGSNARQQIVSLEEQNKPAPRVAATVNRAPRPRRAQTPEPPQIEYEEEVVEEPAEAIHEQPGEVAVDPGPRRPAQIDPTAGGGSDNGTITRGGNTGVGIGDIIGVIGGVVIRGGVVLGDGDHCPPPGRRGGRRPPVVQIPGRTGRWPITPMSPVQIAQDVRS